MDNLVPSVLGSKIISSDLYEKLSEFTKAVKSLPSLIADPGTVCGAPLYQALLEATRSAAVTVSNSVIMTITRSFENDKDISIDFVAALFGQIKPQVCVSSFFTYHGTDVEQKKNERLSAPNFLSLPN